MIWVLFFLLLILLFVILIGMSKNIYLSEPTFVLLAIYSLSTFFVILNYNDWNVGSFQMKTVEVIFLSLLAWIIGDFLAKLFYKVLPKKVTVISEQKEEKYFGSIDFSNAFSLFAMGVVVVFAAVYLSELVKNSGIGFRAISAFLTDARQMLKDNEISISFLATQVLSISRALAMVFTFAFIWNFVNYKKVSWIYLGTPACYLGMSLLTSGRIYLIYYAAYCFVLYFMIARTAKQYKISDLLSIFIRVLLLVCIILVVFASLANFVGRNTQHSIFEQVSIYFGGPLISFDIFFADFSYEKPEVWGEETLAGLYHILRKAGLSDVVLNRHLEYIRFGDNWGNVYSALRRYLNDYGYQSTLILMGVFGFIYSFFHTNIVSYKRKSIAYVLYAMLCYPVFMMPIDDVLLSSLLSINTLFDIVYIVILYDMLISEKFFRFRIRIK